jgi:hypothetical protein
MVIDTEQLPLYKCHKEVRAVKIERIEWGQYGGASLYLEGFGRHDVAEIWVAKHSPVEGGYYVRYKDGYSSFSPADAFEEGYTRI